MVAQSLSTEHRGCKRVPAVEIHVHYLSVNSIHIRSTVVYLILRVQYVPNIELLICKLLHTYMYMYTLQKHMQTLHDCRCRSGVGSINHESIHETHHNLTLVSILTY